MRNDLLEIVRNVKSPNGLPYLILVSNWSGMTEEKYLQLREAGINQFSVSLTFLTNGTTTSEAIQDCMQSWAR